MDCGMGYRVPGQNISKKLPLVKIFEKNVKFLKVCRYKKVLDFINSNTDFVHDFDLR